MTDYPRSDMLESGDMGFVSETLAPRDNIMFFHRVQEACGDSPSAVSPLREKGPLPLLHILFAFCLDTDFRPGLFFAYRNGKPYVFLFREALYLV